MPFLYTRRPPDFPPAMATAVLKVGIPALGFITRTPNPAARFNFGFCPEIQFGGIELRHRIFKRHRLSCLAVNNSPTMSMPLLKGGNNNDLVPTPIVVIDQDSDLEATMVEITFGDRLGALRDTNEIMKLKSDMQTAENGSLRIDGNTLNNEELNELRCQVATLRYQLEAADSKRVEELMEGTGLSGGSLPGHANEDLDTIMLDWGKDDEVLMDEYNEPNQTGKDTENIELTKRQYFAALIFAREMPGEESLVPAAEFRSRLESFLGIPSFSSFVSDPSTLHSLKKI